MCERPWPLKPIVQTPMRLFASRACARALFGAAIPWRQSPPKKIVWLES